MFLFIITKIISTYPSSFKLLLSLLISIVKSLNVRSILSTSSTNHLTSYILLLATHFFLPIEKHFIIAIIIIASIEKTLNKLTMHQHSKTTKTPLSSILDCLLIITYKLILLDQFCTSLTVDLKLYLLMKLLNRQLH